MKRTSLIGFCLSAVLVLAAPASAQLRYKAIDLGTLPGGAISNAFGVNDHSQVVGVSQTTGNFNRGFLWTKKTGMTDLGILGGNFSSAQAINDAAQIAGQAETSNAAHAFLYKAPAGMQDLGILGGVILRRIP
jgi:probable HAF family extracellular repeat protein